MPCPNSSQCTNRYVTMNGEIADFENEDVRIRYPIYSEIVTSDRPELGVVLLPQSVTPW